MEIYFTLIISLAFIIGLIFLTKYCAKWLNKRVRISSSATVKILERVNLGPDKALMIVSVAEKYMLLGVTQEHIEKIADLEKDDIKNLLNPVTPEKNGSFTSQLLKAISSKKADEGGGADEE